MELLQSVHFWAWSVFLVTWGIRLTMVVVAPLRRTPATAKAWLLLIFFEPILGLLLFLILGRVKLPAWRIERSAQLGAVFEDVIRRLANHPHLFHPEVSPELAPSVRLAENLGRMPILGGNDAELLVDYQGTIDRLVADIDAAQHHVHLLFYIFGDDATTARVLAALRAAAARGVQCRVLVDALGSRPYLKTLLPKLREAGVAAHVLLPVGLFSLHRARFDLRNHRKIAVIDGWIGYTGSQNLVDPGFKPGLTYEELMVRLTGPAVLELQFVFAADWYVETGQALQEEAIFPAPKLTGARAVQALPSGPGFAVENNQRLVVSLIHGAKRRVVMTTPYLIPDEPLLQALQTAVLRGVEVHLIVSQAEDQVLVCLAQKSYYDDLLAAGVQVHRYKARFLHAKHISFDDDIAWIGSSNMDIRSFALNSEITLLFYDQAVARRLQVEQTRYFAESDALTLAAWRGRPLRHRIAQNLARLFSPLL